ncbi:MAG: D-alanyl-D-alanine carboxypeptidase family protein, partial [Oscillospiraceae bacterium]
LVNLSTDTIVFEKNPDEKLPPASLTKIMTAIIVLENIQDLDNTKITLTRYINDMLYGINAQLGGILIGETLSARQLIHATLIQSANEAALMLADYVGDGSIDYFVELMNKKAVQIGTTNTHFANPTGLADDANYSTARDMALIAEYAMEIPMFMEIVSKTSYDSGETSKHKNLRWITTNKMMTKDSKYYYGPVKGMKTGSLPDSGRSVISTATKNGLTYLFVALNAPYTEEPSDNLAFEDSVNIYKWVFENFQIKSVIKKGENLEDVKVKLSWKQDTTFLASGQDFATIMPNDIELSSIQKRFVLPDYVNAPVKKGQELGHVELILADEVIGRVPLVSTVSLERSSFLYYLDQLYQLTKTFGFKFIMFFIMMLILFYIFIMIAHNKRNARKNKVRLASRNIRRL